MECKYWRAVSARQMTHKFNGVRGVTDRQLCSPALSAFAETILKPENTVKSLELWYYGILSAIVPV